MGLVSDADGHGYALLQAKCINFFITLVVVELNNWETRNQVSAAIYLEAVDSNQRFEVWFSRPKQDKVGFGCT